MISELFEVAIVVEDLWASIRGDLAPYEPAEPMRTRLLVWTPKGVEEIELLITYTRTGPVRLEVVNRLPGSLWDMPGVQHYGWFSDDLAGDSRALAHRGMPLVASRAGGSELPWQFAYHECPPFGLVELVDVRMREFLEGWWSTGHPPLGLYPQALKSPSATDDRPV